MEGSIGKILSFWLVEVNILQIYGFLTERTVCFDYVAQQTMKNRLFSFYLSANQVIVLVKSVIFPFIDFFPVVYSNKGKTQAHKRRWRGEAENKEAKMQNVRHLCKIISWQAKCLLCAYLKTYVLHEHFELVQRNNFFHVPIEESVTTGTTVKCFYQTLDAFRRFWNKISLLAVTSSHEPKGHSYDILHCSCVCWQFYRPIHLHMVIPLVHFSRLHVD